MKVSAIHDPENNLVDAARQFKGSQTDIGQHN